MNFAELLISNLLGFILGIIASFFSWWLLFKILRPRIEFSDSIGKIMSQTHDKTYRVKIANTSSRNAIDLEIIARVRLARVGFRKNTRVVEIALDIEGNTKSRRVYLRPGVENGMILHLYPSRTRAFLGNSFPAHIREKAQNDTLELEDILGIHPNSFLEICIFSTDDFSGTRTLAISKNYTLKNIHLGSFELNGLKIVEPANPSEILTMGEDDG